MKYVGKREYREYEVAVKSNPSQLLVKGLEDNCQAFIWTADDDKGEHYSITANCPFPLLN